MFVILRPTIHISPVTIQLTPTGQLANSVNISYTTLVPIGFMANISPWRYFLRTFVGEPDKTNDTINSWISGHETNKVEVFVNELRGLF